MGVKKINNQFLSILLIAISTLMYGCDSSNNNTEANNNEITDHKVDITPNNASDTTLPAKSESIKLTLEQVKTECRLSQQILRAGLIWRFAQTTAGNNVNNDELKQQVKGLVIKAIGAENLNFDSLNFWVEGSAAYGSALNTNGMIGALHQASIDGESKCVEQATELIDNDGAYIGGSTIINWDKTSNTDWQIKTIYDN